MIRPEEPKDQAAVRALNTSAFESASEADLVDVLREQARPVVSLVAEHERGIVGHIMFSPVSLTGHCQRIGFGAVVVLGHPGFYPRFGFVPSTRFGIRSEYDAPEEAFMAMELQPGYLACKAGTIRSHAAFADV
jgi:putative acetyltransferase